MSEDEIIDLIFNQGPKQTGFSKKDNNEILNKLNEIERLLQYMIKTQDGKDGRSTYSRNGLCEQILQSTYVIIDEYYSGIGKNYFILDLEDNRKFVTFKDTMDLLNMHFSLAKDEQDLENKLPKRLFPLFRFMRRSGLIYFDYEKKRYFIVDYK
ncbi:hypothetical protein V6M85_04565 [Sulfolobus tengchongensis]|uniref:Uncharacterized protein n=1 Tax=Sulfolobus tengchongensis TaxID=207809 RepID=A0AAX4L4M1_9CREN